MDCTSSTIPEDRGSFRRDQDRRTEDVSARSSSEAPCGAQRRSSRLRLSDGRRLGDDPRARLRGLRATSTRKTDSCLLGAMSDRRVPPTTARCTRRTPASCGVGARACPRGGRSAEGDRGPGASRLGHVGVDEERPHLGPPLDRPQEVVGGSGSAPRPRQHAGEPVGTPGWGATLELSKR